MSEASDRPLSRRLGPGLLTAYGVGVMVGAGIYVLVGAVAGLAGPYAWVAFALAGLVAAPTAFSFAELSSRIPEAGGAAAYLRKGFAHPSISVIAGLAIVLAGTVSAAAVLRGGVGYLTGVVAVTPALAMIGVGLLLTAIAVWGVVESLAFVALLTLIEIAGLGLVIYAGMVATPVENVAPILADDSAGIGFAAILAAAALAFFAFIGFEDVVNMAEETRNPTRTVPIAVITSLVIVSAIYAAVAFAATRAVAPEILAGSDRPLTLVWQAGMGGSGAFLSAIAVAAALNGVLAQVVMAARVLFGLGRKGGAFGIFHRAHPRFGTPALGTVLVGAAVILAALALPVAALAEISATVLLLVFIGVNVALIRIKARAPEAPFRVPAFVPVFGVMACLAALAASAVGAWA